MWLMTKENNNKLGNIQNRIIPKKNKIEVVGENWPSIRITLAAIIDTIIPTNIIGKESIIMVLPLWGELKNLIFIPPSQIMLELLLLGLKLAQNT